MPNIASWELIILLFNFIIFYKLKFGKKFIIQLFNKIRIYLPFNEEDYKNIIKLKKEKNKEGENGIIRSADIIEYTRKSTDEKYLEFEFFVIFYLVNVSTMLMYEFKNFLEIYFAHKFEYNINDKLNFNIVTSFSLISFVYIIYYLLRNQIFLKGFFSIESRIFYGLFIISFSIIYIIFLYYPEIFNIRYSEILQTVNDRFSKITFELNKQANFEVNIKLGFFGKKFGTENGIKIYYSFIFAVIFSILYRPCMRSAYFDHFMIATFQEKLLDKNLQSSTELKKILYSIKGKIILVILELYLLLEPLFYKPFLETEKSQAMSIFKYLSIIGIVFIIEFYLDIYYFWHQAFIFNMQNYEEIMKFNRNPSEKALSVNNGIIKFINGRFWNIFLHLFILIFFPIFIYFSFIFRNNLFYILFSKKDTFDIQETNAYIKKSFFECSLFFILLAFIAAKVFISFGRLFYLLISGTKKKDLYLMG